MQSKLPLPSPSQQAKMEKEEGASIIFFSIHQQWPEGFPPRPHFLELPPPPYDTTLGTKHLALGSHLIDKL